MMQKYKETRQLSRIEIEKLEAQDLDIVKELIQNHYTHTYSDIAEKIISNWNYHKQHFIKIMPIEYKAALEKMAKDKINSIIK